MGGGGGGNNSQMMMMAMMMQQMQQQQAEQARRIAADNLKRTQGYEKTNLTRYQDLVNNQNTKLGDVWKKYNDNIDQILKIDPTYSAHKKFEFTPYKLQEGFAASDFKDDGTDMDQQQADENIKLLDGWYSGLDKQSFDDFKNAEKQMNASQVWLNDARQKQDIMGRVLPGAPPGSWGGGGQQVSGFAGADSLGGAATGRAIGGPTGPNAPAQSAGTGFIGGDAKKPQGGQLADIFAEAMAPKRGGGGAGAAIF